jgi:hypothetical protein
MTLNHNTTATLLPIDHCFTYNELSQDKDGNDKITAKSISLYADITLGDKCFYRAEINTMKSGKVKNCLTLTVNYDCSISINYNHERVSNKVILHDDLVSKVNLTYSKLGLTFITMIDQISLTPIIDPSSQLLPLFWNNVKEEVKIDDQSRLTVKSIKLGTETMLSIFSRFTPNFDNHKSLPIAIMADHAKSKLTQLKADTAKADTAKADTAK